MKPLALVLPLRTGGVVVLYHEEAAKPGEYAAMVLMEELLQPLPLSKDLAEGETGN